MQKGKKEKKKKLDLPNQEGSWQEESQQLVEDICFSKSNYLSMMSYNRSRM